MMAADGKSSKIPKFSFGFRRTKKEEDHHSNSSSPENHHNNIGRSATPTNLISGSRSAPGSNESSPKVSRSKSLRMPRPSKYSLKSHSHTSISEANHNGFNDRGSDENGDIYPDTKTVPTRYVGSTKANQNADSALLSPRGRSHTISHGSSSSNHSSRSNSPSVTSNSTVIGKEIAGGNKRPTRFGFSPKGSGLRGEKVAEGYSLSQDDNEDIQEAHFQRSQRRTQSFSVKNHTHVRSGSHGNAEKLVPPVSQFGRNHPSRRSKTPTSSYKATSSGLQQYKKTGQTSNASSEDGGQTALTRTTSLGKVNRIKRVEENGTSTSASQQKSQSIVTRRNSGDNRGRRPVSMVGKGTPDLNKLAHEISSDDQPESKLVRPRMTRSQLPPPLKSRRSQSALDHHPHSYTRHTPSPTDQQPVSSTTSQTSSNSSNDGPGSKSYEQPTIASSAKVSRPSSSNSHYSRHNSFGSQTNLSSASTESFRHELNKKKSLTNLDSIDQTPSSSGSGRGTGGRASTPSSGRNTPVHRNTSGGRKGRDSTDSGTVSSTTAGRVGTSGLPPRTPYRVARTMVPTSSGPAGINELEGSVLLEADDYLRVCHDVKGLKTVLLRLKREIQTDTSTTPSTGTTPASRIGRSRSSPSTDPGGATIVELKKKLKLITSERDKALEEVGKLKKETQSLSTKVTTLNSDLSTLNSKHSKLETEFNQVEGHRDMLLDKVERLHADKHKLEDRLMSFEKASVYEQTLSESWLDELDGDDSLLDVEDMEEDDEMVSEGSKVNHTADQVT